MHVHSYSVAQSCLTLCDPMDCSPQAPLSIGFSRQEYWGGLPLPTLGSFGIFLTQGSNLCLLYPLGLCIGRQILANLSYLGSTEASKSKIKVLAR